MSLEIELKLSTRNLFFWIYLKEELDFVMMILKTPKTYDPLLKGAYRGRIKKVFSPR